MRYFFYGTLLDDAVRGQVLRRQVPRQQMRRAVLSGFRRVYRRDAAYPVLVADPAGRVEGLLVIGLNARDGARLAAYEGPEYALVRRPVKTGDGAVVDARLFLPRCDGLGTAEDWCYEDWCRRFGDRYRARVARRRRAPSPHPGFGAGEDEGEQTKTESAV